MPNDSKVILIPFPLGGINANSPWEFGGGKFCNELTLNVMPYDRAKRSGGGVRPGTVLAYFQSIDIPAPPPTSDPDVTVPAALMPEQGSPTLGTAAWQFTVQYSDDVSLNTTTFGTGDIHVTGPSAFAANPSYVSKVSPDAAHSTATYSLAAPGGTWNADDDGPYTFAMAVSQVSDTAGNMVPAGTLRIVNVNFSGTPGGDADIIRPTAVYSAQPVPTQASSTFFFTVDYADNVAVDPTTFDSADISVVGPNDYNELATYVSYTGSGAAIQATYSIPGPSGFWGSLDNGTYIVSMIDSQVSDTSFNYVAQGEIGSFVVNYTTPGGDDGTPPSGDPTDPPQDDPPEEIPAPGTCSLPGGPVGSGPWYPSPPFPANTIDDTTFIVTSAIGDGYYPPQKFELEFVAESFGWYLVSSNARNIVAHAVGPYVDGQLDPSGWRIIFREATLTDGCHWAIEATNRFETYYKKYHNTDSPVGHYFQVFAPGPISYPYPWPNEVTVRLKTTLDP